MVEIRLKQVFLKVVIILIIMLQWTYNVLEEDKSLTSLNFGLN